MHSPSHDELHKWLHPHLEMFGNLETTINVEKARKTTTNICKSHQTYHQYFN